MSKYLLLLFLVVAPFVALLLVPTTVVAQGGQRGTAGSRNGTDPGTTSLEREKLELERQKFVSSSQSEERKIELEREKLEIEKSASKFQQISGVIPLVLTLATLVFSIISFGRQAQQQRMLQNDTARLQFEIKAAEIAFSGKTPRAVANRAKLLKAVFPDRLPDDFATNFEPREFGAKDEPSEDKKLFLDLLLKYPQARADIYDFWLTLFPGDKDWLSRVETSVKINKSKPEEAAEAAAASKK